MADEVRVALVQQRLVQSLVRLFQRERPDLTPQLRLRAAKTAARELMVGDVHVAADAGLSSRN